MAGQFDVHIDKLRRQQVAEANAKIGTGIKVPTDILATPGTTERPPVVEPTYLEPGLVLNDKPTTTSNIRQLAGLAPKQGSIVAPVTAAADISKYPTRRARKRSERGRAMMATKSTVAGPTADYEETKAAVDATARSQQFGRKEEIGLNQGLKRFGRAASRNEIMADVKKGAETKEANELSSAESDFNKKQEALGSTMRSRNGVTYDLTDAAAETTKDRKKRGDGNSWSDTSDFGLSSNKTSSKSSDDEYRPSTVIPTFGKSKMRDKMGVEGLESSAAGSDTDTKDLDNAAFEEADKIKNPALNTQEVGSSKEEQTKLEAQQANEAIKSKQFDDKVKAGTARVSEQGKSAASDSHLAGKTTATANKTTTATDEDIYEKDGSLKPAYDLDKTNNPELTTSIREAEVPEDKVDNLKDTGRLAGMANKPHIRGANVEVESKYQEATDILGGKPIVGQQMRKVYVEGGGMPKATPVKPEVETSGTVVPTRFLNQEGPEYEPRSYGDVNSGVTTDEERQRISRNRRGLFRRPQYGRKSPGAAIFDPSIQTEKAETGRNPFQTEGDVGRLQNRMAKYGEDYDESRYDSDVIDRAKAIGRREGTVTDKAQYDNVAFMNGPEMRKHIAKSYVLGKVGMGDDESEKKFDAAVGARGSYGAEAQIDEMHDAFKNIEHHQHTKTYTFEGGKEKSNDPSLAEAHFRTSTGGVHPMADVSHPEHPLKGGNGTLTGSAAPLKVVVPGVAAPVAVHEGWSAKTISHPDGSGKRIRVFEKSNVPKNATPLAHIYSEGIKNGLGPAKMLKQVLTGKETGVEISDKDIAEIRAIRVGAEKDKESASVASRAAAAGKVKSVSDEIAASGVEMSAPSGPLPAPTESGLPVAPASSVPRDLTQGVPMITPAKKKGAEKGLIYGAGGKGRGKKPTEAQADLQRKMKGENKTDARVRSVNARKIEKNAAASAPKLLEAGSKVYHPGLNKIGTVVSHSKDLTGGSENTTATINFGTDKDPDHRTFTGPAVHRDATDRQNKVTQNATLHEYTEYSGGGDYVTHPKHGAGTILGSTSDNKAHVKFDSGTTKMVPFDSVKFGGDNSEQSS